MKNSNMTIRKMKEKYTSLYQHAPDIRLVTADGVSMNMSRSVLTMFSPFLTSLLTSTPCCTSPTFVLPYCSSTSITSLMDLLKHGFSRLFSGNLRGLKQEVIETAEVLGLKVTVLEYWGETIDQKSMVKIELTLKQTETLENDDISEGIRDNEGTSESDIIQQTTSENSKDVTIEQSAVEEIVNECDNNAESTEETEQTTGNDGKNVETVVLDNKQTLPDNTDEKMMKNKNKRKRSERILRQNVNKKARFDSHSDPLAPVVNESAPVLEHKTEVAEESIDIEACKQSIETPVSEESIETQAPKNRFESEVSEETIETEDSRQEAKIQYTCNVCNKSFGHVSVLTSHYVKHFRGELKKTYLTSEFFEENMCKICDKEMRYGHFLTHVCTKHGKLNEFLEERGLLPLEQMKQIEESQADENITSGACLLMNKVNLELTQANHNDNQNVIDTEVSEDIIEKYLEARSKYKCDICNILFDHMSGLASHFVCHFHKELKETYSEFFGEKTCNICDKEMQPKRLLIHVCTKHGKLNEYLEERGLKPLEQMKQNKIGSNIFGTSQCSVQIKNEAVEVTPTKSMQNENTELGENVKSTPKSELRIVFPCEVCGKVFNHVSSLGEHYSLHFRIELKERLSDFHKDNFCTICQKEIKQQIIRHIVTHGKLDDFLEEKGFKTLAQLKAKSTTITAFKQEENPIMTPLKEKTSLTPFRIKENIEILKPKPSSGSARKVHPCGVCDKSYAYQSLLGEHYYSHFSTELKERFASLCEGSVCIICGKNMKSTRSLVCHISVRHGKLNGFLEENRYQTLDNYQFENDDDVHKLAESGTDDSEKTFSDLLVNYNK